MFFTIIPDIFMYFYHSEIQYSINFTILGSYLTVQIANLTSFLCRFFSDFYYL